jgi:hypothetical protein
MILKFYCLLIAISLYLPGFADLNVDSSSNKTSNKSSGYLMPDVKTGERLFYGLIPAGSKSINCAACHNIDQMDTFNWNPSALDIAVKCAGLDTASFKSLIMNPAGKLMSADHDSLQFTDKQIYQLQAFLSDYAKSGGAKYKPLKTNLIIFVFLALLFCLSIIDLTVTKKIRFKIINVVVLIVTLIILTTIIVNESINLGRSMGYMPDQPIKFSHKVHAGQNKTECLYCHYNAVQSKFAGIPPVSLCMNCHIIVGEGSRSGKFEIGKIYESVQNNIPVQWIKVYNLPDHVFFSHSQHVVAGKIDCKKCHNDVANMDQIVQANDLSMGFCIHCHRETGVQTGNKFYEKYNELYKNYKAGKMNMVTVENIGGTDCMKCHY